MFHYSSPKNLRIYANFSLSVANPVITAAYGAGAGGPAPGGDAGGARPADEVEERPEELD